jgi:moderate conductance mechanosensitive channel
MDDSTFFHNPLIGAVLTVLAIIIIQIALRTTLDRIVEQAVRRQKHGTQAEEHQREKTLKTIFRTASAIALWTIGVFVILWQLDVNIAALLTGAGLVSIVAGLGAQNLIKDWLAGVFIILENQYRIDDVVTLTTSSGAVASGVVEDISIRVTKLRDFDGNLQIVTNGVINVISNMSFRFANVNVDILLDYKTDVDQVEKIINEVGLEMAGDEKWKSDVIEAVQFLRVDNFTDVSVTVKAYGKVRAGRQWDVAGEFRRRLRKAFQKHHIAAPFPDIFNKPPQK